MRRGFLASQGGYTIIAVIVEATVLLVSFLGLYIGILYAEAQLVQNYHARVATLLAAGEVDWQMRFLKVRGRPDYFIDKEIIIEEYPELESLKGKMTMNVREETDMSTGEPIDFLIIEVKIRWLNPVDRKFRSIMVREDYFR
ncbi:MAG: hypothetical protein K8R90_09005 [Candidatus Cloacimonetes bacterium]|nr:hypothetical protein [Candidatus Cloacimonadota bacterium]